MDKLRLTPRLQCVADCIQPCRLLADIGTDHAYIPIYSIQNGIAHNAIASDVVKGPLQIAEENIKKYGFKDKILTAIADGLDSAKGADVIVIAGMGGKLICSLIQKNKIIAKSACYMVLQPMTCSYELRKFLHSNGFLIADEKLTAEENKIYNIMVVKPGIEKYDDEFFYYIGKKLFENQDPLLSKYIRLRAKVLKKQINGMKQSLDTALHTKAMKLEKVYNRFIKEADMYDQGC